MAFWKFSESFRLTVTLMWMSHGESPSGFRTD